jgi:predicted RND superfamily exporter protein
LPPLERPSLAARYCRFIARHARVVLLASGAVFLGAVALASRLELRTSFSELLPSNDPGVMALDRMQKRIGDLSLLLVGVRSPDRQANLRYVDKITEELRALPPRVVALATYHVRDVHSFFKANQWLYVGEDDLTTIRDRLRKEVARRKNPLLVDLGLDEDEPVEALRQRVTGKDPLGGRFPDGVLSNADGTYVWIAALPPGGMLGERSGESLHHAAVELLRTHDPRTYHPEMVAHIAGPVASLLANRDAVERDILWVTLTCALLVGLSILLFFRRWRSLPLIGMPAVTGTVMAFAFAELAFGYVNSSTAFLGSIILGNGINYAIIFMSRYQEQRAAGDAPEEALARALAGVVRATAVAAICASVSYASLILTSFRGFYQFGVMGAAGVLFCWLATFVMLPALIVVSDRHALGLRSRRAPLSLAPLARLISRRAPQFLLGSVAVTVLAAAGLLHFKETPFEYDFRRLSARLKVSEVAQEFEASQSSLFGRWPQPTIVLADDLGEVETIRAAIRRQDTAVPGPDVIGQIVTIYNVLPGTPEVQARKIQIIEDIRRLKADKALELLDEKDRKQLEQLDPPAGLRVLAPADLPPLARRPFTEVDGTIGRVILVYLQEKGVSIWSGHDLLRMANVLQRLELPELGKTIETSGSAVVFAAMIRSVLHDGPRATVASIVAVLLIILLVTRPLRGALLTIATLLMGVIWMVGAAGFAEVKITFLNFIALPITFGIGAEYAINVVARHRESGDMERAVMSTGSAVALCSWTTIVGYGSLLAARNRALQGFGAMAILGEGACLVAAIVALPSLVLWLQRRQTRRKTRPGSKRADPAADPRDPLRRESGPREPASLQKDTGVVPSSDAPR